MEKLESNFLKITNDIITDLNTVKITENLIAYSSRTLMISRWAEKPVDFILDERNRASENAKSMKLVLEKAGWRGISDVEKFARKAAIDTLRDFSSSVVVDLDEKGEMKSISYSIHYFQ